MLKRTQLLRCATVLVATGAILASTTVAEAAEGVHGSQTLTQNDCEYEWNATWGSGIGYMPNAEEIAFGGYTTSGKVDYWPNCQQLTISKFNSIGWALYDQDHNLTMHKYLTGSTQAQLGSTLDISASGPWYLDASSTWGRLVKCATYYFYSTMQTENDVNYEPPHSGESATTGGGIVVQGGTTASAAHTINGVEDSINVPGTISPVSTSVDMSDPVNVTLSPFVASPNAPDTNSADYPPVINTMLTEELGDAANTGNPTFDSWMNSPNGGLSVSD